jgi:L-lactate dehydrogenase complex protein LldE
MRVQLFVTCIVDQLRPSVGEATVEILERCGCTVEFDERQTCCGQPAFNSGHHKEAKAVAGRTIDLLSEWLDQGGDAIVCPSGSCSAMIAHSAELLADDPLQKQRAQKVAASTWELTQFLVDVMKIDDLESSWTGRVTFHDACHGLRDLGIGDQPRRLLGNVKGLEVKECASCDRCCGFGGTFSVNYPLISGAMADDKIEEIDATGVDAVVSGDVSCLMQIEGRLKATNSPVKTLHIAQLLAKQDEPS